MSAHEPFSPVSSYTCLNNHHPLFFLSPSHTYITTSDRLNGFFSGGLRFQEEHVCTIEKTWESFIQSNQLGGIIWKGQKHKMKVFFWFFLRIRRGNIIWGSIFHLTEFTEERDVVVCIIFCLFLFLENISHTRRHTHQRQTKEKALRFLRITLSLFLFPWEQFHQLPASQMHLKTTHTNTNPYFYLCV